jgi:cyanate lyase
MSCVDPFCRPPDPTVGRRRTRGSELSVAGDTAFGRHGLGTRPVPVTRLKQRTRKLFGMTTRAELTEQIVAARLAKGLAWQQLADAVDRPVVWTTSALLGQHPIPPDIGATLVELLGLDEAAIPVLAAVPMRGGLPTAVPTDPTIYRFYEALSVYGGALKELIHEQFGDGIMSAINFSVDIERKPHPGGERVVVTFDGKFLSYEWNSASE